MARSDTLGSLFYPPVDPVLDKQGCIVIRMPFRLALMLLHVCNAVSAGDLRHSVPAGLKQKCYYVSLGCIGAEGKHVVVQQQFLLKVEHQIVSVHSSLSSYHLKYYEMPVPLGRAVLLDVALSHVTLHGCS